MFDLQNRVSEFCVYVKIVCKNIRIFRKDIKQNNIPLLCDEKLLKTETVFGKSCDVI